jgi:hypothetical protein
MLLSTRTGTSVTYSEMGSLLGTQSIILIYDAHDFYTNSKEMEETV